MSEKPEVTRADGEALVEKLQSFRTTLTDTEQLMLDNILAVFQDRLTQPEADDLLADFPEAEELLGEVSGFQFSVLEASGGGQPVGPTVTTVTITTTAASHPWITCAGGGFVAQR